jgi:hypothetical protein
MGLAGPLSRFAPARPGRLILLAAGLVGLGVFVLAIEQVLPTLTFERASVAVVTEGRLVPPVYAFGIACLVVYASLLRSLPDVIRPNERDFPFDRLVPHLRAAVSAVVLVSAARHLLLWHNPGDPDVKWRLVDAVLVSGLLLGSWLLAYLTYAAAAVTRRRFVVRASALAAAVATMTLAIRT